MSWTFGKTVVGPDLNPLDRNVGIEIEVEWVRNLVSPPSTEQTIPVGVIPTWTYKGDGSLRNHGCEFITPPVPVSTSAELLKSLYSIWNGWRASHRTGIHVHVDVRDYTPDTLESLLTAYCLAEPALFDYVGQEREQCIYCVPWYRADSDVDNYLSYIRPVKDDPKRYVFNLRNYLCKYSSFYLEPIRRFGTVEFRHAPTWDSHYKTAAWVTYCANLVNYAKDRTPVQVWQEWNEGPTTFLQAALGSSFPVPTGYAEMVEALDADYNALRISGIEAEDAGWCRNEDTVNLDSSKLKEALITFAVQEMDNMEEEYYEDEEEEF